MYAGKGPVVEEWADRWFFRPVGYWLANSLAPTVVSADGVTLASLILGVAAGHLFFYSSVRLNALGVALFIVSDVLDSADGQLARLRGTSTRMGRILDGLADTGRFVSLYAHLGARLYLVGWGWSGPLLALAAILSHSYQAAAADYIRQAYLYFAVGKGSELDLPEHTPVPVNASIWTRVSAWFYGDYLRRQAWLFPRTTALARSLGGRPVPVAIQLAWAERQRAVVEGCAWIAQNIRFLLLAVTAVPGWPAMYCWIVIVPLNLVLIGLILAHEREPKVYARLA